MTKPADAKAVFQDVRDRPTAEQAAFLDAACGGDAALRARVEALLAADERAGPFLSSPTGGGADASAPREQPGTVIGHFKLQQEIGEGGFGTVWMAEQQQPVRRQVALKVVKRGMDTRSVIARFEQERQALAMMDHPNIAKVFDGGETPAGRPYFAMELVRGVPITQYCDQQHLDAKERLALFVLVCHAVQHAHQKGIIHRDIKPTNVLVTLHDGVPVPKVIDFGIAKAVHRPLTEKTLFTEFQQMIGTPEYMSPEQAELSGLDIDTRADIYSLGVLLYELLTGTLPFDASTLAQKGLVEMLRAIREDEPQKPSTRVSTPCASSTEVAKRRRTDTRRLGKMLRGDLDWIVMKALEKDRARRYVSADAFAADVQRHLRDEPVLASPPGRVYRLRKYVRRHRVGVIAGAAVATALLAGLSAAVWGYVEASDERDNAFQATGEAKAQTELAVQAKAVAETERENAAAAQKRAEEGEAAAKREALRANTVLDFVDRGLTSASLHESKGRDYKVRDLLDDFDRELGTRLQGEPEADAAVRALLGRAYRGLGLIDKAAPHLEQALAIRRQRFGGEHREVGLSLKDQGMLAHDRGDFGGAMATLDEARRILMATSGPESIEIADLLGWQSDLQRHLGHFERAEQLACDAVAMSRNLMAAQDPLEQRDAKRALANNLGNLASALHAQGKARDAVDTSRQVLEMVRELHGDEHRVVATSIHNLATFLPDGNSDEAEDLHQQALAMRRKLLGDEHPEVALSLLNLAVVKFQQGRLDDAEGLLRRALAIYQKVTGEEGPVVASVLNNLAVVLQSQGKLAESEEVQRRSLALHRQFLGDENPEVLVSQGNLAALLVEQGKLVEARDMIGQVLEVERRTLRDDHPRTLRTRHNLASVLRRLGNLAEAEAELRLVLQELGGVEGDESRLVAKATGSLADVLNAQGRYTEAEELARRERVMWQDLFGDEHPDTAGSLTTLGQALRGQGRLAEAEALVREALVVQRKVLGDESPAVASSLRDHAIVLRELGKHVESETEYRQSLAMQRKLFGDDAPGVAAILPSLVELLMDQGKFAEAEEVKRLELELARRRLPAGDPEIARTLAMLGFLQLQIQNHAGAELTLRECLAIRREKQPDQWPTFSTMSSLGGALSGQGKYEEADPLLLEGYKKMPTAPETADRRREALERLIKHYEAWNKPEATAEWRRVFSAEFPASGK